MRDEERTETIVGRRGGRRFVVLLATLIAAVGGCAESTPPTDARTPSTPPARAGAPDPLVPSTDDRPTIVFLGDSLTAGFGIDETEAFPALVADALADDGRAVRIVNAGITGDTSAGGLARLDWLLRQRPEVLVVGLGGNDGLRGLDPDMTETNLGEIVRRAGDAGAVVVLLGMMMPPNYGPEYTERFAAVFPAVAEATGAILVPFMLEGVGGVPAMNLPDGIHPNPDGHAVVAQTVLPAVREALERAGDGS